MGLLIGLLSMLLVLLSLVLILLVLIQLPKKDAGAGLAFGAGTSDALFGAGSGTVLSRVTKYACGGFLLLSLTLSVLYTHQAKVGRQDVLKEVERKASAAPVSIPAPATNAPATPVLQMQAAPTNAAKPATNAPVAPGR